MPYNGDIGDRPDELDGCWSTWTEQQSDNVVRNTMDKGNVKTRRRFTGITRAVTCSVKLTADKYVPFKDWFNRDQRQGTIPTYVKTPYGTYELFLWTGPPNINWIDSNHFEASVTMYQGSNWT
jgi:hypothetical protein